MTHAIVDYIRQLPQPPRDTFTIYLQINPRELAYLTSIFESYPGYALIRTDDAKKGIICLWVAPDFMPEVREILAELKQEMPFTEVDKI
jgi:hypothetical protein